MRSAILALVCAIPSFGAYAYKATVTIPAASSTETNFTALFSFSGTTFKTLANGGVIQNTVTFDNITVPADLIITADSTCATQSTYTNWGWLQYNASGGTGLVAVLIPSYSSSGSTVLYLCYGNASISSYQGGSRGGEYDSNTVSVLHLADNAANTTVFDASATAFNFTGSANTSTGSVTGPFTASSLAINSASVYATASNNSVFSFTNTDYTLEFWVYPLALTSSQTNACFFYANNYSTNPGWFSCYANQATTAGSTYLGTCCTAGYTFANPAQNLSVGAWQSYAVTLHYVSGISFSATGYVNGSGSAFSIVYIPSGANTQAEEVLQSTDAYVAEMRFSNVARSSTWLADEYTNQSSVPAATGITPLTTSIRGRIIFN